MANYTLRLKCGTGFDSLEPDYPKVVALQIIDQNPDVEWMEDKNPFDRLKEASARYRYRCPWCDKVISLPSGAQISKDARMNVLMNPMLSEHSLYITEIYEHLSSVPNHEVVDVTYLNPVNTKDYEPFLEKKDKDTAKEDRNKQIDLYFKIAIGLLIFIAVLRFAELILKLNTG